MQSQGSRNEGNRKWSREGGWPSARKCILGLATFDIKSEWQLYPTEPFSGRPYEVLHFSKVLLKEKGEFIWQPPFPIGQRFTLQDVNSSQDINSIHPGCTHLTTERIPGFSCCSSNRWRRKKRHELWAWSKALWACAMGAHEKISDRGSWA